jgi:hypothetical protein
MTQSVNANSLITRLANELADSLSFIDENGVISVIEAIIQY